MTLRSNFPVGSPRWATRRTQWRMLGVAEADLDKPKIAIVNSSSGLAPCFSHLDAIAVEAKQAVQAAGGLAFEIRTVAPTDFIMAAGAGGGYVLSSRDLLANDIEAAVEGAQLDGMLCLASCDKTAPGQLMAAARLDVPSILVACGYQPCGTLASGERVDIEEVFIKAGHVASGRVTLGQLCDMSDRAIQGPGVCTGMGTANSMHIMAEALGMTVAGSTPVRANSEPMWQAVREAGRVIVEAVLADRRPRSIITTASLRNAAHVLLAVSGSINCIKHLQAVAREAEIDIDMMAEVDAAGRVVRPLAAVRPNGAGTIEDFEDAGGALTVQARLADVLDTSVRTVTGDTLGERLAAAPPAAATSAIGTLAQPAGRFPTIRIVRGSLAPDGAIVKLAVDEERELVLRGPARVFEAAVDAISAIDRGDITAGDVLVLRGVGPVGTPGMGMASNVVFALDGAGLTGRVAVVTDGQLSGLVNKGIVLGEVRPEGALDGPLALVMDGDEIAIDVNAHRADLIVSAEVLRERGRTATHRRTIPRGWLGQYAATVEPLSAGATLRP